MEAEKAVGLLCLTFFFVWSVLYTCVCIMQKQLKSADKKESLIICMVCILFRRFLGPTVRINCSGDQGKTFANSRLKAKIFTDL